MDIYQCMECHGMFSVEDLIRYGDAYVCGKCKPVFMQKLSEGTLRTAKMRYAGFWRRFVAVLIDNIILGIFNFILQMIVFALAAGAVTDSRGAGVIMLLLVLYGLQIGVAVTYETVLIGKYGSTVGKRALSLEVVTAEGKPVSYGLAFGRYFAKLLSAIILFIGYIMAGFDSEKRALHDRICNTRVIVR